MDKEIARCIVTFKKRKDLLEKIDYYLKNKSVPVSKGYQLVMSKHTMEKRIDRVLEIINMHKQQE